MKPRLVLLYARDRSFDRVLKEALLGTRAIVLIARSLDSEGDDRTGAVAFAKSARICLSKPFSSAILAKAIASLCPTQTQLAVA